MAEEKKKGFFGSLFAPKSKGSCCCNIQFEEVPKEEVNNDKKEITKEKIKDDEQTK